jgi:phosphatidylserine/phosphatidylglycerophosphate/cardiolipin synthase-like enzyme
MNYHIRNESYLGSVMPIYYYASRPETIVSIIASGHLPTDFIKQANINTMLCTKNIKDCFDGNYTLFHNVYIVHIELSEQSDFLTLNAVPITSIRQITVLSNEAKNHLQRIFNNKCPVPIKIRSDVFPESKPQTTKRLITDFFKTKQSEFIPAAAVELTPTKVPRLDKSTAKTPKYRETVGRLSTLDEHIHLLKLAFEEAKQTILITSFGINKDTFTKAGLIRLITTARSRNIRIYIYYNDQKQVDKELLVFLKNNDVMCAETYTHSKILAVDRTFIASGSFNWLSGCNSSYKDSEEGSFYCRDREVCEGLIEEFWKYIKYYRNHQFKNYRRVDAFDRSGDKDTCVSIELQDKSNIIYIPTLDQHCGFLQECLDKAKTRMIICSPFISGYRQYEDDLAISALRNAIKRGVNIYFIVGIKSKALSDFEQYLEQLESTNIHIIAIENIHLKTIIVDDFIISEGSFNWLSASRDDQSDYHNHEQTLVVEGVLARPLIESFLSSRVGQTFVAHSNAKHKSSSARISSITAFLTKK